MTAPIEIDAGIVGFNRDERIVSGMLLPIGEECRSSVGRFSFDAGAVTIPDDVPGTVALNLEHSRETPIGRAVTITATAQGILGTFRIAGGPDGDQALDDIATGKRRHLSAEVRGLRIKGGRGIAAALFGAALVAEPAFPSAALFAAADTDDAAADTDPGEDELTAEEPPTSDPETTEAAPATEEEEREQPAQPEGDAMPTATATTGFAAAQPETITEQQPQRVGLAAFARAIVEARRTGSDKPLEAIHAEAEKVGLFALADQTYDGAGDVASATNRIPQYLSDIWEGDYVGGTQYSQHFDAGVLTDLVFKQRTVTQRPLVAAWAGNKTDIPSRKAAFTSVDKSAQRFAGGLDIAREHYDFNKTEDIAFILQLMGESYRENSEAYIGDEIKAAATPLALDAATKPAEVNEAHWKLVRGALAVLREGRTLPTVAFIAEDLYDQMLFTGKEGGLEYLTASLNLAGGTLENFAIVPDETLDPGSVLVAARKAAQVLTLPGSPIRVTALDIARGGVDEALFGYVGVRTRRAEALQLVTTAA